MSNIPDNLKNNCPLDHSTYEKFIECDCNFGLAREIWYFKEQQLQQKEEQLINAERVINNYAIDDDVGVVARRYFKQKQESLKTKKEDKNE